MTEGDDAWVDRQLEADAAEGFGLRRVMPPAEPGLSYLGGAPRLPAGLDWPRTADGRGLSFLGQIHLPELPAAACRSLLPASGTLFFFVNSGDELTGVDEAGGAAVLQAEDDLRAVPPRDPPAHVMAAHGEEAHYALPWLSDIGPVPEAPKLFPRWPVELRALRTYPHRYHGPAKLDGGALDAYGEMAFDKQWDAFEAAFGPAPARDLSDGWAQELRWPDPAWPPAWIHVQVLAAQLADRARQGRRRAEADSKTGRDRGAKARLPAYAALEAAAGGWWRRAAASPFTPVPQADRDALRAWLAALDAYELKGFLQRFAAPARTERLPDFAPRDLNDLLRRAAVAGGDACLGYGAAALLPAETVERLAPRHAPAHRAGSMRQMRRHQLLGLPREVQNAAEDFADHVLLAQFDYDDAMFWHWGDVGVIQFWIRPEDLAARRFERAVASFEGH